MTRDVLFIGRFRGIFFRLSGFHRDEACCAGENLTNDDRHAAATMLKPLNRVCRRRQSNGIQMCGDLEMHLNRRNPIPLTEHSVAPCY